MLAEQPEGAAPLAHPRFSLEQLLGEGGFGVVYAAFDAERQERVALKLLRRMSAAALDHFKREFRALSRLTHPNLPLLYELFCKDDRWFFTMELLAGQSLRAYVTGEDDRLYDDAPRVRTTTVGTLVTQLGPLTIEAAPQQSERPRARADEQRLRHALDQLVDVIGFIHRRGYVHGDIKPSNVMVAPDGRLYLLDFGLVARQQEWRDGFAGTTAYAAPELREGGPIDRGHDAYALGSMLFELATGHLPFPGVGLQPLLDKATRPAPRVHDLDPDVAADLATRIDRWLATLPTERAAIVDVSDAALRTFVGRASELQTLHETFRRAVASQRCEVVVVEGKSGFGKSALIESFVRSLGDDVVVISSRASPKEHLPFNALDGLLDAIGPLPTASDGTRTGLASTLKAAIRDRAAGRPLVLWIDDVHWADADSVAVLEDLVQPPRLRSCLLLLSRRPQEAGYTELPLPCPVARLELGALAASDARALAAAHGVAADQIEPVVARAGGMALFLEALCASDDRDYADAPSLIAERVRRLPPTERALLDVLSLSQSPLPTASLGALLDEHRVADGAVTRLLETLCRERLLRPLRVRDVETFAPFHDQVRETVVGLLSPDEMRGHHERLLTVLPANDPRLLGARFEHLRGADRRAEAATLALEAADAAERATAYEQAALHVEQALALGALATDAREALLERLIDLYERAKLGPRAATIATELARTTTDHTKRLSAILRAVRHHLACGAIDRGKALLSETFVAAGEAWPKSEPETMLRLFLERTLGLYDALTPGEQEARYQLLNNVSDGLALIDSTRSFLFVSRAVARARASENPEWIALQLLREGIFFGSLGEKGRAQALRNVTEARAIIPNFSPEMLAWETFVFANMKLAENPRASTAEALATASQAFAALPGSDGIWASNIGLIRGTCLRVMGDLPALRAQADWLAREAEHRKDTALRTTTRFGGHLIWLADDAPEVSRHLLSTVPWPARLDAFHFQHWLRAEAEIETSLYEGDGENGWARIAEARRPLLVSTMKMLQTPRVSCNFTYGRGLLGALEAQAERHERLRWRDRAMVAGLARWLTYEGSDTGRTRGALLRAGLASVQGDRARAATELAIARDVACAAGYRMYEALAILTLAAIGAADDDARGHAEMTLAQLGVVAPRRFVAVEIPGFRRYFGSPGSSGATTRTVSSSASR